MAVSVAPSAEAAQAIVDRINAGGTAYTLTTPATWGYELDQDLSEVTGVQVFVLHDDEETLEETFDIEGRTSHDIRIFIRQTLSDRATATISAARLIERQIYQQVNNFKSSNGRVKVWECGLEKGSLNTPAMTQLSLLDATIPLRVEVEVPT